LPVLAISKSLPAAIDIMLPAVINVDHDLEVFSGNLRTELAAPVQRNYDLSVSQSALENLLVARWSRATQPRRRRNPALAKRLVKLAPAQ
jgi:hypothetical protein